MDFSRRRFLTVGGLSIAGLILPKGVMGQTHEIIQAVQDPIAVSMQKAKALVDYWEANPTNYGDPMRKEVVAE